MLCYILETGIEIDKGKLKSGAVRTHYDGIRNHTETFSPNVLFSQVNSRLGSTHWTSAALILPDMVLIEVLKTRSCITVEGSWRKGAMVTLMEPEAVFKRSTAGASEDDAGWGIIVTLIDPDIVVMERRSRSRNVPETPLEISLIEVERDMMEAWIYQRARVC